MIDFAFISKTGSVRIQLPSQMTVEDFEFVKDTVEAALVSIGNRLIAENPIRESFKAEGLQK